MYHSCDISLAIASEARWCSTELTTGINIIWVTYWDWPTYDERGPQAILATLYTEREEGVHREKERGGHHVAHMPNNATAWSTKPIICWQSWVMAHSRPHTRAHLLASSVSVCFEIKSCGG